MNQPLGQMQIAMPPAMEDGDAAQKKESFDKFLLMGWCGIGALILVLLFFLIAPLKGAVIAPGALALEGKPQVIQHVDGGIVGEIFVRDGSAVKQGDVLMRLDPTAIEANRSAVETRRFEMLAFVARLTAERDNANTILWPASLVKHKTLRDVEIAMEGQQNLFEARKRSATGRVNQLDKRIAQSRDQISGLRSLVTSNVSQISLISQELVGLRELVSKGFASKTRVLALEREQARLNGDMASRRSEIGRLENLIRETQIQINLIRREREEEVLSQLRQAETDLSDLSEQLTTAADQRRRVDVKAPVAGLVHNMQIATIGGVIAAGEPIMSIISQNDNLIIETQVQPGDIDQIYTGQETRVNLSAFNQRTTPQLRGIVKSISADRLMDPITGLPYYTVIVIIPPNELALLDGLDLIPGMPAEAFMQTQNRSAWSYLMKPVVDAMRRAGREE